MGAVRERRSFLCASSEMHARKKLLLTETSNGTASINWPQRIVLEMLLHHSYLPAHMPKALSSVLMQRYPENELNPPPRLKKEQNTPRMWMMGFLTYHNMSHVCCPCSKFEQFFTSRVLNLLSHDTRLVWDLVVLRMTRNGLKFCQRRFQLDIHGVGAQALERAAQGDGGAAIPGSV